MTAPLGDCILCGDPTYLEVDGRPVHLCCDWWAQRGHSRCPACSASREAESRTAAIQAARRRDARTLRREKVNA